MVDQAEMVVPWLPGNNGMTKLQTTKLPWVEVAMGETVGMVVTVELVEPEATEATGAIAVLTQATVGRDATCALGGNAGK